MSQIGNRMFADLRLAGVSDRTQRRYLRAVGQLAGYHVVESDQLSERQAQDYLLCVHGDLGIPKGTFAPLSFESKLPYFNTLACDWTLFSNEFTDATGDSGISVKGIKPFACTYKGSHVSVLHGLIPTLSPDTG